MGCGEYARYTGGKLRKKQIFRIIEEARRSIEDLG
jgi:SLT domain-containing protein